MKNSLKITTSFLIMIFLFTSFGFGQEEVRIQKLKTLMFDGESKKAEVKIKYKLLNSEDSLFLEYVTNSTDNA